MDNTVAATLDIFVNTPNLNAWIFDRLRPWCGSRVIEVGAGLGTITKLLADREFIVATEIEERFLTALRDKFADAPNVAVEHLDLEAVPVERLARHQLDTILCVNVLEHIKDDEGALAALAAAMSPGGRLLLYVPALEWLYGSLDRGLQHHRRYSATVLRDRMERAGWTILHLSWMNVLGIPGWFLNSRMLKRTLLPVRQVALYDRLTPLLRLEDRLHPPIGMSLVVVGEKR